MEFIEKKYNKFILVKNVTSLCKVRIAHFILNWRDYISTLEALVLLIVFGVAQRFIPMSWWSGFLGRSVRVPEHWQGVTGASTKQSLSVVEEREVAIAIGRACQRLPFSPTCLAQASAGQGMLRHRGRSGVVVIGLRRNPISTAKSWEAHAWLLGVCGAITGGKQAEGFTPTNVFEVPYGLLADEIFLNEND